MFVKHGDRFWGAVVGVVVCPCSWTDTAMRCAVNGTPKRASSLAVDDDWGHCAAFFLLWSMAMPTVMNAGRKKIDAPVRHNVVPAARPMSVKRILVTPFDGKVVGIALALFETVRVFPFVDSGIWSNCDDVAVFHILGSFRC